MTLPLLTSRNSDLKNETATTLKEELPEEDTKTEDRDTLDQGEISVTDTPEEAEEELEKPEADKE